MKKNLCFLRQSGSSHAHRSFIDQSTAGLALCGFWRYPYRLSTRLSRPFVGNPAFIHKLPKASPPPVDRTSGQFLINSLKARPTGLSALYKQALHIDLNRNWGKFPSAIASIVPATSERKNFVFFLKPLRPRRVFSTFAPTSLPVFSIHRLAWARRGQYPSPFRQRVSPEPSSSVHKRLFSLKTDQPPESPAGRCPEATANTLFTFGSTVFVDWTGYPATGVEPRG